MKDEIVKERHYNQSIDKVWNAITKAEEISKWFISADFKLEKGYQYTLTATEAHGGTQIKGEVLEVDPYTLKYTWDVEGTGMHTIVSWMLEEENGKTKLTLVHSGIAQFGEQGVEMMGHFDKGWEACLQVLPNYLENEATEPAH